MVHLHQLYAVIDSQNLSTLTLFQTLGYHQVATLPDWLYDGHHYHEATVLQLIL